MEEKTSSAAPQENKMGVLPVGPLLFNMAVPMMISMLFQALYNIVDSIFVGMLSQDAFNAVSLAFPLQSLCIAVGTGTGVGMNALLSRSLGQKKYDLVNRTANTGIFLYLCSGLLFALVALSFAPTFFRMQTANEAIIGHGTAYIYICLGGSVCLFMQICLERLLQATGRTGLSMACQIVGAVTNIIMDPILIFGLFGMPRMEVAGAALATVMGQLLATLTGVVLNLKYNPEISIRIREIRFNRQIAGEIYRIGIPSIIMQSIGSVMTFCMNRILIAFTEAAVAVLGAYFKLQSFIFMPIFGLNNGIVPIVAYNFGAARMDRVKKAVKLGIATAVSIMVVGMILMETIPGMLLGMFTPSEEMLRLGTMALRIIAIHFPLAGFCIVAGSACQALGKPIYSLINSICRQLVVLLPSAWLLAQTGNLSLVWFAFPISEVVSLILSAFFLRRTFRFAEERIAEHK